MALSREVRETNVDPPGQWSFSGAYCALLGTLGAAPADSAKAGGAPVPPSAGIGAGVASEGIDATPDDSGRPKAKRNFPGRAAASDAAQDSPPAVSAQSREMLPARIEGSRIRMTEAARVMNLYSVEIHKKFALAVACMVFVLLGAPIALRFPRGGVGLTIGVSLGVFGLYYVALIGGQSLGSRGIVAPALAMWGANMLFGGAGLLLLSKLGTESATSRGGDTTEMVDALRSWLARRLGRAGMPFNRRRPTP